MKSIFTLALLSICTITLAQQKQYEPNKNHPYGRLNPDAPTATGDFDLLIGTSDCTSVSRNPNGIDGFSRLTFHNIKPDGF